LKVKTVTSVFAVNKQLWPEDHQVLTICSYINDNQSTCRCLHLIFQPSCSNH